MHQWHIDGKTWINELRHTAGSLVPSDRKVRSLLINTKLFWMITFLLWWDTSISVTEHFDGYKNDVWYATTRFPWGWTPVGVFGPTCHPVFSSTNIKNPKKKGRFSGRMVFHPSGRATEICWISPKARWRWSGSVGSPWILLKKHYVVFFL